MVGSSLSKGLSAGPACDWTSLPGSVMAAALWIIVFFRGNALCPFFIGINV
jgi:hypothetical protein